MKTLPLLLTLGCLPVDPHAGHGHLDARTVTDFMYDPQEGVRGKALPTGTSTVWPTDEGIDRAIASILAVEGIPSITFDRQARYFNSVMRLPPEVVSWDAQGWSATVDLGGLSITVADHPLSRRGRILLAPGSSPQEVVVLKHYLVQSTGQPALSWVGVIDPDAARDGFADAFELSSGEVSASSDCEGLAWAEVADEGLPELAVVFPPLSGCDLDDCVAAKTAWIRGNHDVYRVRQMLEFMNSASAEQREWLWSQRANAPDGSAADVDTSMVYWFGAYAQYRFDAVRWTFNRLWQDYHDLDMDTLAVDLECRPGAGADICNTAAPPAHHAEKSSIKLCDGFFDSSTESYQALLMVHEPLHHVFVPWNDNGPRLDPITDTHTHGHGSLCTTDVDTEKAYGITKVRELATYTAGDGGTCWHRNYAFRNNDTYGWAALAIGGGVRDGSSVSWPQDYYGPGQQPTPHVPEPCSQPGGMDGGAGWDDPLNSCHKVGQELVCPGSGSGVAGAMQPDLQLTYECPDDE